MKKIAAFVIIMAVAALAQQAAVQLWPTFCTEVHGIEYCTENETSVSVRFHGKKRITIDHLGEVIFDMKPVSGWLHDPATGDSTVAVEYDGFTWYFTVSKNSYILEDNFCSKIEFWDGAREDQRASHGYIRMDSDDMFKFEAKCEEYHDLKPRKAPNVLKKFNSGRIIVGYAGQSHGANLL